jgi:superfamily II DNA or RNA helicase
MHRTGRILRAKRRNDEGFKVFFYSLVPKDTQEMHFNSKRKPFLVDHGYSFKIITQLQGMVTYLDLVYETKNEQIGLLSTVLVAMVSAADFGTDVTGDLPRTFISRLRSLRRRATDRECGRAQRRQHNEPYGAESECGSCHCEGTQKVHVIQEGSPTGQRGEEGGGGNRKVIPQAYLKDTHSYHKYNAHK